MHEFIDNLNKLLTAGKITAAQKHEMLKDAAEDFSQSARVYCIEPKK